MFKSRYPFRRRIMGAHNAQLVTSPFMFVGDPAPGPGREHAPGSAREENGGSLRKVQMLEVGNVIVAEIRII